MDLVVLETGNGGDVTRRGNDLAMYFNGENNIYLAMFGGNPGFPTRPNDVESESFDYWGNRLFNESFPTRQFNSETEELLKNIALNSAGRQALEQAILKDLNYLRPQSEITVQASILSDDWIQVNIKVITLRVSQIKIINFRKSENGDFRFSDFNDDFNV
jgi:hypothetical protein